MSNWIFKTPEVNIDLMSEKLSISKTLATVLANRQIKTKNQATVFLAAKKQFMHSSNLLKDMDKLFVIVQHSIINREKIAIYGDYDVDGVMSSVILYRGLKSLGADVTFSIPHREKDGYGLNIPAVKRLHSEGINLIITCDNGIAAFDEIKYAKELGMKVVVIDHHEPPIKITESGEKIEKVPEADAVVNQKQLECQYPFKFLCAGALSYKFIKYYHEKIEKEFVLDDELLIFAGVATICDVVDLLEENRIIAKCALEVMNNFDNYNASLEESEKKRICIQNLGLRRLMDARELIDKTIGGFELGFIIGPCINAAGRLETAELAVKLFTTEDEQEAQNLATKLVELNEERKNITKNALDKAIESLREKGNNVDKVIVYYDNEISESVAGIVAGRLKEEFYRPTIVITDSLNLAKGSGRSIEGYNLFEELSKCKHLFTRFGGHAMAAGLSLVKENIDELRKFLNNNCRLTESEFLQTIVIDKEIEIEDATFTLANELKLLEPFGAENREPVFFTDNLTADLIEIIGQSGVTLRFIFTDKNNRKIKAVCFNKVDEFKRQLKEVHGEKKLERFEYGRMINIPIQIVYNVNINEYKNNKYVNVVLLDFKLL